MDREDYITQYWDLNERHPHMDERPEPNHMKGHFDPEYEKVLQENKQYHLSENNDKANYEQKMLTEAFNRLVQTEDGYRVFRWLCDYLSFKGSVMAMVNGKADTESMIFNEARRLVWMAVRKFLNISNRNKIEEDR
jgi:hypothetical protein